LHVGALPNLANITTTCVSIDRVIRLDDVPMRALSWDIR